MARFADAQRNMVWCLSYLTVCRFHIDRDRNGNYVIKKSGRIRTFLYYLFWTNSIIKITYLLMTYNGWFIHVGFLDQMAMWDMFLCFSQLVQETNMWYRKYPLYEVLHANWKVQEEIFQKLGSPADVQNRIMKSDKQLVYLHGFQKASEYVCNLFSVSYLPLFTGLIVGVLYGIEIIMLNLAIKTSWTIIFVGCGAIAIQFLQSPKYAMNTYAIFPFDNLPLRLAFAAHEYFYIYHIWIHQASSIVLCEIFSVTYTNIINQMAETMKQLSESGKLKSPIASAHHEAHKRKFSSKQSSANEHKSEKSQQCIPDRVLDPQEKAAGTEYTILSLLHDYKKVMLASKEFNVWVGKLMAGTNMSNYGQFVSDVFMMIQLLKEPETDFQSVFFFFEDACAGMVMLFRMLILISRVYPASEAFISAYQTYMQHETSNRKYLRKYNKTLRIVATKIGGYSTNPSTVPKGINLLFNYYICAAMWQRPVDRRT